MLGLRRYRLFLLVAALTIATIYHLFWRQDAVGFETVNSSPAQGKQPAQEPEVPGVQEPPSQDLAEPPRAGEGNPAAAASKIREPKPVLPSSSSDAPGTPTTSAWKEGSTTSGEELLIKPASPQDEFLEEGLTRHESGASKVQDNRNPHWVRPKLQFPIKAEDIIPLPVREAKKLPKIQAEFGAESSSAKKDRLGKLATIRESFKHAWQGYRKYALPHDELRPVSKQFADPFMGWGATLVDSLDTLWIMGLEEHFEAAVQHVANIDFTTSERKDIPLFETVIRYLGGLIAAHDLSDHKYPVLIRQAENLAEILMGAFDTPNRMPIPFYNWAPSYTSQAHRASAHIVMAELGSLSMEFTRLAQLTKKDKYYDAVARITNELERWQMQTTMPGLWPLKLDASGCKKADHALLHDSALGTEEVPILIGKPDEDLLNGAEPAVYSSDTKPKDQLTPLDKREGGEKEPAGSLKKSPLAKIDDSLLDVDCEPQGLFVEPHVSAENFGIGGQADSTYEYFPKMFALLGGQVQQYKTMYLESMRAIRKDLLFRPMIEDQSRKILFSAKHSIYKKPRDASKKKEIKYEVTHLSCFAGGMFALGSKLFGLKEDMDLAAQLTDGCVWAYESMPNGVMAEDAALVPCDDLEPCAWNATRWHEALDPQQKERFAAVDAWNRNQRQILADSEKQVMKEVHENEAAKPERTAAPGANGGPGLKRRSDEPPSNEIPSRTAPRLAAAEDPENADKLSFVPKVALSHKKYVAARIQEERLPPGYTDIFDAHYGLRPEAIESVFYMYRVTGDETWRQKGWQMFEAIQRATQTEAGNAAMKDVTSNLMQLEDKMESFWLAETLKYFYLLFSEPSVISLDDYVLNTEAHPFKIPK